MIGMRLRKRIRDRSSQLEPDPWRKPTMGRLCAQAVRSPATKTALDAGTTMRCSKDIGCGHQGGEGGDLALPNGQGEGDPGPPRPVTSQKAARPWSSLSSIASSTFAPVSSFFSRGSQEKSGSRNVASEEASRTGGRQGEGVADVPGYCRKGMWLWSCRAAMGSREVEGRGGGRVAGG